MEVKDMKFGFLSAILNEYTFEEVVDYAADNGFACVEMACWPVGKATRRYAGVTHIDMSKLTPTKVESIQKYLKERNVEISAIGYYPNVLTGDLEDRKIAIKHLKDCIVGAEKLGIPVVNTFIGRNRLETPEQNWKDFTSVWKKLIAFAEKHKVKIAIENCPMYFTTEWPSGDNLASSPAFWDKMFAEIKSDYFGLNYDPSHLVWQRMDYTKPIYDYQDKMYHFHIKDAKFYADKYNQVGLFATPLEYHSPKLPGLGDIEWGQVVSALNDIRYEGAAVLEIEDKAYEGSIEDKLKALELARDYINQYIR